MHSQFISRAILTSALLLSPALHAGEHGGETPMASIEMLTGACVACHGPAGASVGPAIPSLAGLPAVYFIGAMLSYKHGQDLDAAEAEAASDPELEDVEIFARHGTIMDRLASGYTLAEIKAMADYFAGKPVALATQEFDAELASMGEALHADNCEKCHEEGGRSTVDDMVPLAGQWKHYLHYSIADFHGGARGMPKKMKSRLEEVMETEGENGLAALINYYASQQ
jgi:sulfide dehydrogenase cytochrome subunit